MTYNVTCLKPDNDMYAVGVYTYLYIITYFKLYVMHVLEFDIAALDMLQ